MTASRSSRLAAVSKRLSHQIKGLRWQLDRGMEEEARDLGHATQLLRRLGRVKRIRESIRARQWMHQLEA